MLPPDGCKAVRSISSFFCDVITLPAAGRSKGEYLNVFLLWVRAARRYKGAGGAGTFI